MKNRLHTDEFEDYLQRQADKHRIYPGNQIWSNIQKTLHGKTKWPALTYSIVFIIISLTITTILFNSNTPQLFNLSTKLVNTENTQAPQQATVTHKVRSKAISFVPHPISIKKVSKSNPFIEASTIATTSDKASFKQLLIDVTAVERMPNLIDKTTINFIQNGIPSSVFHNIVTKEKKYSDEMNKDLKKILDSKHELKAINLPPVVITTNKDKKSTKWNWQLYITPSASYRRLVDKNDKNHSPALTALPAASTPYIDVNQVVRHKPAMGMEVGYLLGYKFTPQLTAKIGLQFNIRQYMIEAFAYKYEITPVTHTINAPSQYRNTALGVSTLLENKYHELSLPLGLNFEGDFSDKLSWGIGTAVQPTYVFSKQPYIISTNYKNYAEGSSLARKWNINTSIETHLSYKVGDYHWQIGPQFRYQQLSSFSSKYGIKEHLLDYGVKIALSKNLH